ncbi:hypothetical protein B841_09310 [Corynebacterium maris DSM 45190]|uniref:O-antigen polymerase n=1 Tax=Corynebacterium maris DSM 45190 TaxID=1224163 RepID=S5T3W2_9CORY|nr:hypothetical protein [Corynebacterium maris]AGS35335.1 hypothetical protein B841_09310 [Corynebacterium maris DSM 45190]
MDTVPLTLTLIFTGIAFAPALIWLIILFHRRPAFALALGLGLSLLSVTQFGHPAMRVALAVVLLPHLPAAIKKIRETTPSVLPPLLPFSIFTVLAFVSLLWSRMPMDTLTAAGAWVILLLFLLTFRTLLSAETIRRTVFLVLLVIVAVCAVFLLLPDGWWEGRARGMFTNANTLGIVTFLFVGSSLWRGLKTWLWAVPAGLVLITATGSRAALMAAIVTLLVVLGAQLGWRYRIVLAGVAIPVLYPLYFWVTWALEQLSADSTSILRTSNTRSDRWEAAVEFISVNRWLGAGHGATPFMVDHNSYFRLFAEFGMILSFVGVFVVLSYVWWSRRDPVMLALTVGVLVNTFFEDWLLSAGASMLGVYLILLLSTPQRVSADPDDAVKAQVGQHHQPTSFSPVAAGR